MKLYPCPVCSGRGSASNTGGKLTWSKAGRQPVKCGGRQIYCRTCRRTGKITGAQLDRLMEGVSDGDD